MNDGGDKKALRSNTKEAAAATNDPVMEELRKLNKKMEETRSSLEKKMEQMGSSLEKKIDGKINSLRDSMVELIKQNQDDMRAELQSKHSEILANVDLETRIDQVEANFNKKVKRSEFDPDVSIIISGLLFEDGENLMQRVKTLISDGLKCDPVPMITAVERLVPRGTGPGVIKVELNTTQEKVAVLRRKRELKDNDTYDKVYIRSAKSHTERLIDLNFRALLDEMPSGKDFFIAGNGRVVRRDTNREREPEDSRERGREPGADRGVTSQGRRDK